LKGKEWGVHTLKGKELGRVHTLKGKELGVHTLEPRVLSLPGHRSSLPVVGARRF